MSEPAANPLVQGLIAQAERTRHFRQSIDPRAAVLARAEVTALLEPLLPELRAGAGLDARPPHRGMHAGRERAARDGERARTAPLPVFTFWNSPLADAPPLVQACIRRLRDLHDDVHVLDGASARELIDIPDVISRRLERDHVAHFSDYVRVSVLDEHGGIWVDATDWASGPLAESVRPLLCAGALYPRWTHRQIGNWFIAAVADTPLIRMQRLALHAWWSTRDDLPDYFLFHRIFEVLHDLVPEFRGQWSAVPRVSAAAAHALQVAMMHPWHAGTLAPVLPLAPVQKLSYKYDSVPPGSVLERLVTGRDLLA